MKKQLLIAAAFAGALGCTSAAAQDWQFSLTPYLWFPVIKSTVQYSLPANFGGGSVSVQSEPDDYLKNLDLALMLTFEARKGRWGILSDFIYLDMSNQSSAAKTLSGPGGAVQIPVNSDTTAGLKGVVWEVAGSYALSESKTSTFDVLGGFRYTKMESQVNWALTGPFGLFPQSGSAKETAELWDAIIGVRGKAKLGDGNWFLPYYADIGTGDSKLTWQAEVGIGYSFKWGDLVFAYRNLSYEQKSDKPVQELEMSGFALGATFHF